MAETLTIRAYNIKGINTYTNPFLKESGELIHAVNVTSEPYGAKTKRCGYETFLGTPDTSEVRTLFSNYWGTQLYLYRASGTSLYYSTGGTGAWTLATNGTMSATGHVGYAVLGDTLICGDGVGSTRHTTTGTAFTDTTLAPVGEHFEQYQNRIYMAGTASTMFYSTTNDATNWSTGGTADSSSLIIPGAGSLNKLFKCSDRLVASKTSGLLYRWDGYSLVDMSTNQGPSSPYSIARKEGFYFWLNRDGYQGYGGVKPQLLSNKIQTQIRNSSDNAISGTVFNTAPAEVHYYDYLCSVGTVTDGFTGKTITNCVQKYDFQKNEFLNWSLANKPTAWHSYKDADGVQQLIFGSDNGQCYKMVNTVKTDNGVAIDAKIRLVVDGEKPEDDKLWRWITLFFNPGCSAKVRVAVGDTYQEDFQKWFEIDDVTSGVGEFRFPTDTSRGKLLFIEIYESSKESPFTFYGFTVEASVEAEK